MSTSADDAAFQDPRVADFAPLTANSRIPTAFINAVRYGEPGSRHNITIGGTAAQITIGGTAAQITIGTPGAPNPRRETDAFSQLRVAMWAAVTDGIQPELPPEISMIAWQHEGREVRICAPGSAPTLRRARIRRRLTALSPLPMLGWLSQPLAGSATAVGIAIAPFPPMHQPDVPPTPVVREMTGDIARPELPYAPGTVPASSPVPPWAVRVSPPPPALEFTAPDSAPAPTAPAVTVPPSAPTLRAPSAPGTSNPTPAPAEPSPAVTEAPEVTESPSPAPPLEPILDGLPTPEPAPSRTATASQEPTEPHRRHHPRKRHHRPHLPHPTRGLR